MRPAEIIEETASQSIRYEIISDWGVHMIPYSVHTVFISGLKSYRIHDLLCLNGMPMQYGMKTYRIQMNPIA